MAVLSACVTVLSWSGAVLTCTCSPTLLGACSRRRPVAPWEGIAGVRCVGIVWQLYLVGHSGGDIGTGLVLQQLRDGVGDQRVVDSLGGEAGAGQRHWHGGGGHQGEGGAGGLGCRGDGGRGDGCRGFGLGSRGRLWC